MFHLGQVIPALRPHFWLRLSVEAAGPGTVQIQTAGPLSVQVSPVSGWEIWGWIRPGTAEEKGPYS